MSITIGGIPESITRSQLVDLLTALGLDASTITQAGIHIGYEAITCTVFALNEDGERYVDTNGEVVTHEIAIRVTDYEGA